MLIKNASLNQQQTTQAKKYQVNINHEAIAVAVTGYPTREQSAKQRKQQQSSSEQSPYDNQQQNTRPPNLNEATPSLNHYYLYLTEGCNQACQHCWIAPSYMMGKGTGGHVPVADLLKSCERAKTVGLSGVKLTGGEPLLHPDFVELVYGLKALGLNIWMETNLTLLTAEKAKAILDTMTLISTSLDASNASDHNTFRGVGNSFETTCDAVRLLSPHLRLQVIMSIHAGNIHQVEDEIKLAKSLGADSIKFNLIHTQGRADKMMNNGRTLDVQAFIETGRLIEDVLGPKYNLTIHYSWPPAFWRLSKLSTRQPGMCGIDHIVGLLGTGEYALCGVGSTIKELVYGTINDDIVDI